MYNQFTQFEEIFALHEGRREGDAISEQRLHWEAEVAGKVKWWDGRITDQVPDQMIVWQSEGGE